MNMFGAGMLTSRALACTSSKSSSQISSRSSGMFTAPRLLKLVDVPAGDREIDAADHHVALLLGIDERFAHAFARGFEIHDLAFAHAARRRLADAEDLDRAVVLVSPTTAQTFEVPISSPTMMSSLAHLWRNGFFVRRTLRAAEPGARSALASFRRSDGRSWSRVDRGSATRGAARFRRQALRRDTCSLDGASGTGGHGSAPAAARRRSPACCASTIRLTVWISRCARSARSR